MGSSNCYSVAIVHRFIHISISLDMVIIASFSNIVDCDCKNVRGNRVGAIEVEVTLFCAMKHRM